MLLNPRVRNGVHVNENGIVGYTLRSARVHESILIGLSVATLQRQCPVLSSINVLFCPTYVRNRSMPFMSWTLQLSLTSSSHMVIRPVPVIYGQARTPVSL